MTGLTKYEAAALCGGAERVALTVLAALVESDQLTVAYRRQRLKTAADSSASTDGLEAAALAAVPPEGLPVATFVALVAGLDEVRRLEAQLAVRGIRRRRLGMLSSATRQLLAQLPTDAATRVAVDGLDALEPRLRAAVANPFRQSELMSDIADLAHRPVVDNVRDGTIGVNSDARAGYSGGGPSSGSY